MTFNEYWKKLQSIRPIKDGQKVSMTKDQFRHVLDQAFTAGQADKEEASNPFSFLDGFIGRNKHGR